MLVVSIFNVKTSLRNLNQQHVLQATGLAIIEQRLKQTRQDKASKHTIKTNYLDNELDDSGSSTGMSAPGQ